MCACIYACMHACMYTIKYVDRERESCIHILYLKCVGTASASSSLSHNGICFISNPESTSSPTWYLFSNQAVKALKPRQIRVPDGHSYRYDIHTYIHTYVGLSESYHVSICIHICMYVYIYIYIYICTYISIYIHVHACTYVNLYACLYQYAHASARLRVSVQAHIMYMPTTYSIRSPHVGIAGCCSNRPRRWLRTLRTLSLPEPHHLLGNLGQVWVNFAFINKYTWTRVRFRRTP